MGSKKTYPSALFARQEIFDRSCNVCAYELLYRDEDVFKANLNPADAGAGDKATSFVISHLFTDLDLEVILGNHPAFINFTRRHLLEEIPKLLPKDKIVIEILENTYIDDELIKIILSLSKKGYRFALDDFVFDERLAPLIKIADIIKIDVLNLSDEEVRNQLACLKEFQGKLLAEKVETRQQFADCQQLGFHLFQGYFFNKPDLIRGEKISENKTYLLKLLAELHNPGIQIQRVEEVILQIPKLSYRILRLANSVALYTGKKIEGLLEAIQQLGLIQIRNWISLLLLSSLDDVLPSTLELTLIRAKMCQLLAHRAKMGNPHQAYIVGMLSNLDAILNESMKALLSKISLTEELNLALLEHQGDLGYILSLVKAHEAGHFELLQDTPFSASDFNTAYAEGIEYMNQVMLLIKDY